MMWAPPMMVRMSEACPGQSTNVTCTTCSCSDDVAAAAAAAAAEEEEEEEEEEDGVPPGSRVSWKVEKPRSSVMPLL